MPGVPPAKRVIGRYEILGEIASGGMATVHYGRLVGPVGFSRRVAIKELHPHFARDPEFVSMLVDEARLAAHVRHPNVVPTLDVVVAEGQVLLVMEYVEGASLADLRRAASAKSERIPPSITVAILAGVLYGLHAAHEANNDAHERLSIVHRDVSPQNILVGADGVARVLDFGVAKAASRLVTTRDGKIKGKLAYMSPEQLMSEEVDRRTDVYAAGVVLWEALVGARLFEADSSGGIVTQVLTRTIVEPSRMNPAVSAKLDAVVMRSLSRNKEDRFASARQMAEALEEALRPATAREVALWVEMTVGRDLLRHTPESAEAAGSVVTQPVEGGGASPNGDSPITSLSAATPSRGADAARGERTGMRWAGAAVMLAMVSAAIVLGRRSARAPVDAAPRAAPHQEAATVAAPPVLPLPSASVVRELEAGAPQAPASAAASTRVPTTPKPSNRPHPVDCSPPYTVDAEGLKVYKPQCLR